MCVQNSPLRKSASVGDWIFDSKQVWIMSLLASSPYDYCNAKVLLDKKCFRFWSTSIIQHLFPG